MPKQLTFMELVNRQHIFEYIPQRDPICLVHTIYESSAEHVKTGFFVEEGHLLVSEGCLTEAGITENLAQSAAAHAGYIARQQNMPPKVGFIGNIKDLQIHSLPPVNREVITEVRIKAFVMNVTLVTASSTCNGAPVATCEMKIFLQE